MRLGFGGLIFGRAYFGVAYIGILGYGNSDWLRKWREFFVSNQSQSEVNQILGRFSFSQNFLSNRLKRKWHALFKWKFSGRPSELLHFFHSNRLERKVPFHLHKISISTAHESACAYTDFLRHHDLPMRLQVFRPHG